VRLARASDRGDTGLAGPIAAARRALASVEGDDRRRTFLNAQLDALERRARFVAGERTSIRDEARALGLEIPAFVAARAAALRSELDAALPGREPLVERLAEYKRTAAIPRSRLDVEARSAIESCRTGTPVPDDVRDGGLDLRYVVDRPWPAFTTYAGEGKSTVELRRDVAWTPDDLESVLCHETYPGHHLQNLVWAALPGRLELSVVPMFTPHAVVAERSAVAATMLMFPRDERPTALRILDDFAPLALATAIEGVDGEIPRGTAISRLRDELLMPDAEGFMKFVEQYRSMAAAYVTPSPEVRDWSSYFVLLRSPYAWTASTAK
jgi:hypothetical protein